MKPKRKPLTVADLSCRYLVNACSGTLLRPLPGSTFELIRDIRIDSDAIPLSEFAWRQGLAPKTLHNRISRGELRSEHGLEKRHGRWWVTEPARFASAIAGDRHDRTPGSLSEPRS